MINPEYLCYVMNSTKIRNYGFSVMKKSINQANISGELLKQYKLPIPTLKEQEKIVFMISKIEHEINAGKSKIESLQKKRKAYVNDVLRR